ncbi:MAG: tetratricopeptide repeat protein [Armatimonadota bacterium]|nr:tetratricopeptide repeat protein [Armatimonadota bacterium]
MEMCRKLLVLYVALLWLVYPAGSQTSSTKLRGLFENAKNLFWQAEPRFHVNFNPIESLPPLSPNDPDVVRYRRAAQVAEAFLTAAGPNSKSTGVPIMLYFAAMSYSRISQHEKALHYISRLLAEFPNYKRPRLVGYPEQDRPVKSDLLHLKLWHMSRLKQYAQEAKDQSPLVILKSVAQDGIVAIQAAAEREAPQRYLDLEWLSPTPDQLRTAALPSIKEIVAGIYNELLPVAIQKDGAKAVREYLRTLAQPKSPFYQMASTKLASIDRIVLAQYRQEAEKAIKGKRFDDAKAAYRRIIEEYPGTDAARSAETELQRVVPVAVAYYKGEGDKNFRPNAPDQFGVPQSKAREYFEKMYKEDPNGPQADHALYYWSRGLGTEGKVQQAVKQLKEFLERFPDSPLRTKATYLIGFYYGSQLMRRYDIAVEWMQQVIQKYPESAEAPEALWHIAFYLAYGQKRYQEAIPYLEQLQQKYPDSPRAKHTAEEIQKFRERMQLGGV